MYVYRTELQTIADSKGSTVRNIFAVGYYYVSTGEVSTWYAESEHTSTRDAAARTNYLNGGTGAATSQ